MLVPHLRRGVKAVTLCAPLHEQLASLRRRLDLPHLATLVADQQRAVKQIACGAWQPCVMPFTTQRQRQLARHAPSTQQARERSRAFPGPGGRTRVSQLQQQHTARPQVAHSAAKRRGRHVVGGHVGESAQQAQHCVKRALLALKRPGSAGRRAHGPHAPASLAQPARHAAKYPVAARVSQSLGASGAASAPPA